MKSLKFVVAAMMVSGASLAMAQTSAPAADSNTNQSSIQSSIQSPNQPSNQSQSCVGPASYCTVFFGGS
ncbi:hypothetical protein [Caballeronia sp. AZ10_KS36]|uniref:hypothetical protein n=1 Tax=Caballeronia sp. AZ10_KS36 TaxID=2921757 RepID=UPI002027F7F1|nr:hypothetical protein [Caballeronia sp. AZ10_KS36]